MSKIVDQGLKPPTRNHGKYRVRILKWNDREERPPAVDGNAERKRETERETMIGKRIDSSTYLLHT